MKPPLFALLLTAFLSTACAAPAVDVAKWQEEVLLADGTVVQVRREAHTLSNGLPVSRRGNTFKWSLEPEKLGIKWEGERAGHRPLTFDFVKGKPHVVVVSIDSSDCRAAGRGGLPLEAYSWSGREWKQTSVRDLPLDRLTVNLYSAYRGVTAKDDASGFVSMAEKRAKDVEYLGLSLSEYLKRSPAECLVTPGASK